MNKTMIQYLTLSELIKVYRLTNVKLEEILDEDLIIVSYFIDSIVRDIPQKDFIILIPTNEIICGHKILSLVNLFFDNVLKLNNSALLDVRINGKKYKQINSNIRDKIELSIFRVIFVNDVYKMYYQFEIC
ncbi:hypothetical protein [Vallitalea guaymasensis]|uniref:Uncharacterized protein n=1 Tax=Vallitalea guaymasensis TaxID=1185412 RepID=A0A8J8MDV8_9FIRM|nr:hypothetical protein [Vallitalea guaymasensis]QUH31141.1 hypothetical protein HYG85_20335 [Vallitalea guaymasensis]